MHIRNCWAFPQTSKREFPETAYLYKITYQENRFVENRHFSYENSFKKYRWKSTEYYLKVYIIYLQSYDKKGFNTQRMKTTFTSLYNIIKYVLSLYSVLNWFTRYNYYTHKACLCRNNIFLRMEQNQIQTFTYYIFAI